MDRHTGCLFVYKNTIRSEMAMTFWSNFGIIGSFAEKIVSLLSEFVTDKDKAKELETKIIELTTVAYSQITEWRAKLLSEALTKGSMLERNMRAIITIFVLGGPIFCAYVILPITHAFYIPSRAISLEIPWYLWALLLIGYTGYLPTPEVMNLFMKKIAEAKASNLNQEAENGNEK